MAPIRIAFIGLSSSADWAKNSHLPYLKQSSKYNIVGLLNSSKESSEEAIKAFELPSTTKVYSSPEDLANNSDSFDLIVCTVRVDKHFASLRPAVAKEKACYVEWPFCRNVEEAQELYDVAQKSNNPLIMVGLQARRAPIVNKVKELIAHGEIGRVLSSSIVSSAGNLGQIDGERAGRNFNDSRIQCTMLTIHFGHMLDYVLYAMDGKLTSLSAILSTRRKKVQLRHPDGSLEDDKRDTPDQVIIQGYLQGGAVLSMHQRGGSPFKGTPGLVWRIYGEKGEIEVTASGCFLQIGYPRMSLKIHDHQADTVRDIDWAVNDDAENLPLLVKNVARLYEAFADGRQDEYVGWEEAISRKRLLEKFMESSETGSWVLL